MESIKQCFAVLLFPLLLIAADPDPVVVNQSVGDSLAVVVLKADSTALQIMSTDYVLTSLEGGKVNISCAPLVRDSLGRCVRLCSKVRMTGVDTSKVDVLITVSDTIPLVWGSMIWRLDADGMFVRRE